MIHRTYSLPLWLYRALPYLYIAAGVGTILVFHDRFGAFSGATLIAAGCIVFGWRATHPKPVPRRSLQHN